MKVRVVGQDPSMNNWGLVAADVDFDNDCKIEVVEMLVVTNLKKNIKQNKTVRRSTLDLERTRDLSKEVQGFIAKHEPKFTMIEVPHGSQNATSMKGYGICLGILGSIRVPMIQLTEGECKIHAVNKKSASKAEMIDWAMSHYPDAGWKMRKSKGEMVSVDGYNEHLADALAALEAGLYTDQFINTMEMAIAMNG